jgi:hypothetical protein
MDAYAYWRAELAAPGSQSRDHGERRDICGFYRIKKVKTKPDLAVAIWSDDDRLTLNIGERVTLKEPVPGDNGDEEAWNRFFTTNWYHAVAIPEEQYRETLANGWWPFEGEFSKSAIHRDQLFRVFGDIEQTPADRGGNAESADFDTLKANIESELNAVLALGPIETVEQAQKYRLLQDKLNTLHKQAEAARVKEKRPHDEAAAAVQAKWKPIVDAARKYHDHARDTADAWLKEQDRKERARVAAEAERVRIENERIANEHAEQVRLAERAAETAADAGEFLPEVAAVPEPEFVPEPVAAAPLKVAGSPFSTARKARTIVSGKIVDQAKLIAYLVEQKDAGLMEFLQNRANASAKMKLPLPGVERVES